jgi:hypothetical protein
VFKINEKPKGIQAAAANRLTVEPIGNSPISNNDLICGQTTTG